MSVLLLGAVLYAAQWLVMFSQILHEYIIIMLMILFSDDISGARPSTLLQTNQFAQVCKVASSALQF